MAGMTQKIAVKALFLLWSLYRTGYMLYKRVSKGKILKIYVIP